MVHRGGRRGDILDEDAIAVGDKMASTAGPSVPRGFSAVGGSCASAWKGVMAAVVTSGGVRERQRFKAAVTAAIPTHCQTVILWTKKIRPNRAAAAGSVLVRMLNSRPVSRLRASTCRL